MSSTLRRTYSVNTSTKTMTKPTKTSKTTKLALAAASLPDMSEDNTRAPSFAASVVALEVGQCASRTWRMCDDTTLAMLAHQLPEIKATYRRNSQPAIVQARKKTGGQYEMESGEFISQSGAIYVTIVVTRVA